MRVVRVELSKAERELLETLIKKGSDWRERERAETILQLAEGYTSFEVAEKQGVLPETIRERRRKGLKNGFASLPDQPRSGAPSKLNDEHRAQLKQWVDGEALTSRVLITRLKTVYDADISAGGTLRNELKRMGYVWKRTRYSLKKSATPSASSKPNAT